MNAKLSRRSLLTWMAAGTSTLALSACVAPTPAGDAGSAPAAEASDLSIWVWWPDPVASLNQMGESFSAANPGATVTAEAPTDYWTKLQTALAGGVAPDIYFMNNVNYWAWASKDILVDMTALVESDEAMQDNLANSWQGAVDFYNFKGKQFGMPFMYTTIVLYYNEDYLQEQGLTPVAEIEDEFDWTMFRDYAQKLTQRDGDTVSMWGAMTTDGIETGWLNFVRANGGDFLNADNTQCIIDQPAAIEAWQLLTDMRLVDQVSPSSEAVQAENPQSMFLTGKLALWPGGSWAMKTFNEQLTDFTYNCAVLPMSPNTKQPGGTTNIVGLVMNNASESQDVAWKLMTHLLSKESQDIFAQADVLAPVRNDSAELYYTPELGPANRAAAFKMQEWTKALPAHETVTWGEMMQPTGQWQTEIFEGRVGVEEGLQNIAVEVNKLLA